MEKKVASGLMLTFLLIDVLTLASGVQLVKAETATREAGVYAGYRIDYGSSATWESNDPDATIPQYILDYQQLDYFYNVVQSVSGTNVTFNNILGFQNGTERSETRWLDVATGWGELVICLSLQPI